MSSVPPAVLDNAARPLPPLPPPAGFNGGVSPDDGEEEGYAHEPPPFFAPDRGEGEKADDGVKGDGASDDEEPGEDHRAFPELQNFGKMSQAASKKMFQGLSKATAKTLPMMKRGAAMTKAKALKMKAATAEALSLDK